ncbi:MAG TPA: inositol monophosphatase family protein [Gemmatimonadaceae bacterium]|nr:inositol monophosphatase family protein [Gemmatimonadaceae bacterium]HVE35090.1 inositol monophosphatase family protein [Gemmatimonadaceae bacterium]
MTSGQHNSGRALLATCVAAAARAAEIIRQGAARRDTLTWETKSATDFVSDVDRDAERAIREIVAERHPDARVLGEELSPSESVSDGLVFVADPLDGTTNFLHGFPWYAVSIGAMAEGALVAGVVLNAANGELFTATAGGGARLNGQPIRVSSIAEPQRALIGTGFPFKDPKNIQDYLAMLPPLMRDIAGIRRPGSAALDLADVACGRFEAFWELTLSPWDIAAGLLLVREAGGIVTDRFGEPCRVARTSVVAGNPQMHAWLLNIVQNTR